MVEKAKAWIKSVPFLYSVLRPIVVLARRPGREVEQLRRYCATVPKFVAHPVFVKVGANDGITGDLISDILLASEQWKGLLIEPVPYIFDRLRRNFSNSARFRFEQVAIGAAPGKAAFYYLDASAARRIPNLPEWVEGLGSFDRNHIAKHLDGALEPFTVECTVDVCVLPEVLRRNGIREVHLLHIDAEGSDFEVLKTVDLVYEAPAAIVIEHGHLPNAQKVDLLAYLRKHGYSVDDCGGDYFAVLRKFPLSNFVKDKAFVRGPGRIN